MKKHMKKLTIVIEKGDDDEIWGSIDASGFLYTTVGSNVEEITANLRGLVADYLAHEGKTNPDWEGVSENDITYEYEYDLTALFEVFSAIKINSIADMAGINKGLARQYASGVKTASAQQAKKIEVAIRQLGERLMQVSVA